MVAEEAKVSQDVDVDVSLISVFSMMYPTFSYVWCPLFYSLLRPNLHGLIRLTPVARLQSREETWGPFTLTDSHTIVLFSASTHSTSTLLHTAPI